MPFHLGKKKFRNRNRRTVKNPGINFVTHFGDGGYNIAFLKRSSINPISMVLTNPFKNFGVWYNNIPIVISANSWVVSFGTIALFSYSSAQSRISTNVLGTFSIPIWYPISRQIIHHACSSVCSQKGWEYGCFQFSQWPPIVFLQPSLRIRNEDGESI